MGSQAWEVPSRGGASLEGPKPSLGSSGRVVPSQGASDGGKARGIPSPWDSQAWGSSKGLDLFYHSIDMILNYLKISYSKHQKLVLWTKAQSLVLFINGQFLKVSRFFPQTLLVYGSLLNNFEP